MPLPRGIGFGIAEGLNNFANSYRQAQNDQFMRQVYQQQAQKNALETQKLKQETDPVDIAVGTVGVAKQLADIGFLPEDKLHSFALKKLDSTIQTPTQAAYANRQIGAMIQGGNFGRGGPQQSFGDSGEGMSPEQGAAPSQSEAPFQPFHISLTPKQYDTYSKYVLKEPSLAMQVEALRQKKEIEDKKLAQGASEGEKNREQSDTNNRRTSAAQGGKTASFADSRLETMTGKYQTLLKPYRQVSDDVARIDSILSVKDKAGNPLVTKQQLGDANRVIARIFSPNHMSDATVNATEYDAIPADFAGALQRLSANPRDIGSRDLIEHVIDQAHHIGNVNHENALQVLQELDAKIPSISEPKVQAGVQDTSNTFRARFSKRYSVRGDKSAGPSTEEKRQALIKAGIIRE